MRISTIGGNVAENSGGLRGLKYGVTRDYVMGLEVVLADGEIARLGNKCVKDVAGYSLKDLFIGSEGTLGIITEVLLKLVPRPAARRTMLALYDRIEDAAETVSAIIAAQIIPCTLEFLDRMTAVCVEDYAHVGLPTDCEAVLLMETDGHPAAVADEAAQMEAIAAARTARATCAPRKTRPRRCSSRRRGATRSRRWPACGRPRFSRTSPCRAASSPAWCGSSPTRRRAFDLQIGTFGHMGDGNLHPTFLTDERDGDEMHRVHEALEAIVKRTLGARRHDHRRARRRPRQEAVAAAADGRRQLRADAADQADPRSARPAQPRQDLRLERCGRPPSRPSTTRSCSSACTAACACRPARPTTRPARAQQPARPHRADAGDRRRRARGHRGRSPTR